MSEAEPIPASAPEAAAAAVLNANRLQRHRGAQRDGQVRGHPEGTALRTAAWCSWRCCPSSSGPCEFIRHARDDHQPGRGKVSIIASCTLFGLTCSSSEDDDDDDDDDDDRGWSPLMSRIFPESFPNKQYQLLFTQGSGESKEEIVNYEFDTKNLVCLLISSVVGVWYLFKKHWIANNLFGLAFALNGVELLHLNNVSTGCILLGGLFVYDVFWVFGTNVMVTVAKSFEAPIKLVFPQDLLEKGLEASNFAMLGLGDIVIPGIFIALLLRFDVSLKKNSRTYFYSSFLAYIFGLGLTIFVMHTFKHAQPALLYLVPACVGFPVIVALFKGELTEMFRYEESSPEEEGAKDDSSEKKDQ
ncbi:Minor histocompatibility antigen H13 [Collichthys lucidus]|uniref:Minor histocompatibility antigen H13 n=1 Tax=Collichthys lucidus TaxID=240159 RepID=A0A4U5UND6_COLLU|nr:Minor histocompatibility antigen H13 [Collichthys lucidus]